MAYNGTAVPIAFSGKTALTNTGSVHFASAAQRKYLNATERRRFVKASARLPREERLFCLVLLWSGSRISEALSLTPAAIDLDACTATFETLKRRRRGVIRQVPLPHDVVRELSRCFGIRRAQLDPGRARQRLWRWSRTTAWRRIKRVMRNAGVDPSAAMPKGLRHSFGVTAFQASVPPHLVQRWLGHASLNTTAIYGDVMGAEERDLAGRMWLSRRRRT